MATIVVRNLPEATHRALKIRAANNRRSTEAELRQILIAVVAPPYRIRMGSALAAFGKHYGGLDFTDSQIVDPWAG